VADVEVVLVAGNRVDLVVAVAVDIKGLIFFIIRRIKVANAV
jgi:hypothetical protein